MNFFVLVTCLLLFIFYFSTVKCQYFKPTFYKISLDFSKLSSNARTFDGVATIHFNVAQKLYGHKKIILDAESLIIGDISITDSSQRRIAIIASKSGYIGKKYSILFKLDFDTSELKVNIKYMGSVGYAGDTGVFMTDEKNIIATNSYPEGVRKIFPCVNDPSIRTSFNLDVKLVNNQWGIHLVTDYRVRDVLVSSNKDTGDMNKATAMVILNAIAKHFFRCVVSPQTWEDFWLSDSLAHYLQYALLNTPMFHDFNFPDLLTLELQRPAMRSSSIAVHPTTVDPSFLITDDVFPPAYRGTLILKMLEALSSRTEIIQDLFNYFKKFVYKSVNTNEFLDFMSKGSTLKALNAYGKDLQPILDKWIHDIGYPYLTNISITKGGFTLYQKQFHESNSASEWIIPFVYTDSSNRYGTLEWITEKRRDLHMESTSRTWIQLNKYSKGMFRVNYGSMLDELSKEDVYWSFSSDDRAALIDDSFQMAWRKKPKVNFGTVLNLFSNLANEMEYAPFILTMNHINTLRHFYSQKGYACQFEQKIREILDSIYGKVDWYKPKSVNINKAMWTRAVVEATCDYSAATCHFDTGKHSAGSSLVLNDLLPTINCYTVQAFPQMRWLDKFKQLYRKENTQYARADALYALACPRNYHNDNIAIKTYLQTINSDYILTEDAGRAFSYIYSRPEHINQTINYIVNNYRSLMTRFGDDFMAALITDISKLFLPAYYNGILDKIKLNSQENSNTAKAIIKAQEDMATRDSVVNANLHQIAIWLHKHTSFSNTPHPNSAMNSYSSIFVSICIVSLKIYLQM